MARNLIWVALALVVAVYPAWAAEGKYSIKSATTAPPKELSEPVAKLLSQESIQLLDAKGEALAELWFRKEIPAKAGTDAKKGLTYRDLDETTLLGAVRFVQPWSDYRKQKIKPGVYTLRLGFQPIGLNCGSLRRAVADESQTETERSFGGGVRFQIEHPGIHLLRGQLRLVFGLLVGRKQHHRRMACH